MPEDQATAWLMEEFSFDASDLQLNRAGELSDSQRQAMPQTAGKVVTALWVIWQLAFIIGAVVAASTDSLPWPNALGVIASSAGLGVLFFFPLWFVWQYPLGKNRVKTHVGRVCATGIGTLAVVADSNSRWKWAVGHPTIVFDPHHWPKGIPEVRMHYNRGSGKIIVHSIEPFDSRAPSSEPW